jgi:hypothetical protein
MWNFTYVRLLTPPLDQANAMLRHASRT